MTWRQRTRPALLAVVAWLVGAATAVTVGLLALSSVGAGLIGDPADPLAQAPPPATQGPAPAPGPSNSATEQALSSAGGVVEARCGEGGVYLTFWTPAQGFHAEDVIRGPAERAQVKFESRTQEVKMTITCADGVPHSEVEEEAEHQDRLTSADR